MFVRIESLQLQQQTFAQVPRAHSDRIKILHHRQRVFQIVLRVLAVLQQFFIGSGQIPVLVQIADDVVGDFAHRVRADGHAQLPVQMFGESCGR